MENALQPSFGLSAAVGIVGAAVVLFIAFGSLLSMLLPLAVAIAALASGLMTVGLLSHGVSIPSVGPTLGILIGLGVAATIMILVFSAFIRSGQQVVGEIGLGMAAAVLLDAFLLRTLLVPALMHLAGRANWWLPGWLDRALPHLSIEPATPPAAQTAALPEPSRAARP